MNDVVHRLPIRVSALVVGLMLTQVAAAADKEVPKRAAKKRAPDAASRGGRIYDTQPMPVSIQGIAKDQDGQPLAGATVYVAMANGFGPAGQKAVLAQTTTDDAGKYVLKDVMLPVRMFPPKPDVVEGKFQVFGVSDGHGFAWHGVRAYRPRPHPSADSEPDMDRAYYEGEAITSYLLFGPTVRLSGQVLDDLGNPVAGAKVQVGVVANPRRSGQKSYRFELVAPEDHPANSDRTFASILYMPESRLSTTTDAEGRYQIADVPRDAIFLAAVSATPELGWIETTVTTSDKAVNRAESVIANGWNPVFVAPRTAVVRTVDQANTKPLDRVVLHAYGRQIRDAGSEARSDAEGRAVLRLPPGHYRLVAEPANGSPYVRTEQEIDVGKEPLEQAIELGVQSGAIVVLEVVDNDSKPVGGAGFGYETDTSRDRRELQTQTVFVDHPTTDGDGVLRAVVEPGRRRFLISKLPDGYEATDGEPPWTEVAAGHETTVRFQLRKKPPADEPEVTADDTDLRGRLQNLWRRQNGFTFKGRITYRMTFTTAGDYVVTRDEIHDVMAHFDGNPSTDIASWINQHLPELNVRLAGPYQMVVDGRRHRCTKNYSYDDGYQATHVEVFNGAEIVRYDVQNAQVTVDDYRLSRVHIDGIADLRRWPPAAGNLAVASHADGKIVLESPSGAADGRLVADERTGFVYEKSYYDQASGSGQDEFQFAPIELPGGMIWPGRRVLLSYHRGELYTITIYEFSSIEPVSELPADAFVVSVPAGTFVFASDLGSEVSDRDRDRNQPGSHKRGTAMGPVTDAVQFGYALSPRSRSLWPVLKIGQDAPALNAVAWLTSDGAIEAPDLKQKVVLVDFWGRSCGPCVGELPKLVTLAKHYARTDLRIVGWHDSSGDVEGVAQFARKHGLPYVLAIDKAADEPGWFGALFKSFGVRAIPHSALLDRQGKVVFVGNLEEAISRLEGIVGEPPTTP